MKRFHFTASCKTSRHGLRNITIRDFTKLRTASSTNTNPRNDSMIRPGLERITRLLKGEHFLWKAIHVAGTNGKGSICSYLSAMLHDNNIPVGRFTSPHLIDRWDGITINEKPVAEDFFLQVEAVVKWRNEKESIDASSFELLTATAFHIFNLKNVKVGVIECGMGGRLDATNILQNPLVTIISRLGMDHEAFLGDTPYKIASEKAGIMKHGTPCVVDSGSDGAFLTAVVQAAKVKCVDICFTPSPQGQIRHDPPNSAQDNDRELIFKNIKPYQPHSIQKDNMWCAYRAFILAAPQLGIPGVNAERLVEVMSNTVMPGRLQRLYIQSLTGRIPAVFLDGGHNQQAWSSIGREMKTLDQCGENTGSGNVWVIACSKGRNPNFLIEHIQSNDTVIVVEFGSVAGMPWVESLPAAEFKPITEKWSNWINMGRDILGALHVATDIAGQRPLIITGSLYLASDVLRLVRDAEQNVLTDGQTSPTSHSGFGQDEDPAAADRLCELRKKIFGSSGDFALDAGREPTGVTASSGAIPKNPPS